jgi:hypothetical protein
VLVAVGRAPNGGKIGAEKAGVEVSDRGFIAVDRQMRSNVPHIFAIGDLVGNPMLAHKASHEGKLAAEVAAGEKKEWVARVIPSVAYTDPEIAWVGVTETEAKAKGLKVGVGKFPWAASGRAIGIGRTEGFTKLLFDEDTHRIIGGGIVGVHAGDLISEVALAIEMGCEVADIGHTIHPHPTLSESVGMAAEVFDGTITDLYPAEEEIALTGYGFGSASSGRQVAASVRPPAVEEPERRSPGGNRGFGACREDRRGKTGRPTDDGPGRGRKAPRPLPGVQAGSVPDRLPGRRPAQKRSWKW